ncbi:MAG: hypothetical protein ICV64_01545 [Thermoleophilia bacterium]|nr:hypothetical protein [Thermoleophilia bacterium]
MRYTTITAALAAALLAPAAQANHQFGDALLDADGARAGAVPTTVPTEPVARVEPTGFDWGDAAVGAALAATLALLLLALAVRVRRSGATVPRAAA